MPSVKSLTASAYLWILKACTPESRSLLICRERVWGGGLVGGGGHFCSPRESKLRVRLTREEKSRLHFEQVRRE